MDALRDQATAQCLSAQDLLAGSQVIHTVEIPPAILAPHRDQAAQGAPGIVRIQPLNLMKMTLISRAARDDASLVPVLMIKEAVVDPALNLEQIRRMHVGLVHYLVSQVNLVSGLGADGEDLDETLQSPLGETHLRLAQHFGWTPQQVSQLTPGQVAVYLAGIERLLALENRQETSAP
jgi:hypothetical protein